MLWDGQQILNKQTYYNSKVEDREKQMQTSADQQPSLDKNESQTDPKSLKQVFTKEAIETKLISELSQYLRVSPDEINIREDLTAYGLDLCGSIPTLKR